MVAAIHRMRVRRRAEVRRLDELKAAEDRKRTGEGTAAALAEKKHAVLAGIDKLDAAMVRVEGTLAALQQWDADGEGRMATVPLPAAGKRG